MFPFCFLLNCCYLSSMPHLPCIHHIPTIMLFLLKTAENHIFFQSFKNSSGLKSSRKLLSLDLHFTIHYLLLLLALPEHCSLCTAVSYICSPNSLSFSLFLPKPKPKRRLTFHSADDAGMTSRFITMTPIRRI